MHNLQKIILKRLLDKNNQKYSELTRGYSYEENILFHLKQLINRDFIVKSNNFYEITAKGVKEIVSFDLLKLEDRGFKTFFVGLLCKYKDQYLIKEHPQGLSNFYNLPSGKPLFGEKMEIALRRIIKDTIGFDLSNRKVEFSSMHLKTVKTSSGEVLFDDAFAIYEINLTEEQFKKSKLVENITWMTTNIIKDLENKWPEIDICILNGESKKYLSYEFESDYILN